MDLIQTLFDPLQQIAEIGGPVVVVLMCVAALTLSIALYKSWQFWMAGVGRHAALTDAISAWDRGDHIDARHALRRSPSYLTPVIDQTLTATPHMADRLQADAEMRFAKLERGFRFLDSVAQLAPLLGLFGTVLGMIQAFQTLQDAGAQVDPSILAGGIWVALLTTAVGLVVAMPTAVILSWLESRMEAERVIADKAIMTILYPIAFRVKLESLVRCLFLWSNAKSDMRCLKLNSKSFNSVIATPVTGSVPAYGQSTRTTAQTVDDVSDRRHLPVAALLHADFNFFQVCRNRPVCCGRRDI